MTAAHGEQPEVAAEGRFRRLWGTSPGVLLGHIVVIAIAAYALSVMFEERFAPRPWNLILWLFGGAVLHDAVLLPAYSLANVVAARILGTSREPSRHRIVVLNHLRVPTVISGVLFLVFAPRILAGQPQNFERALGNPPPDFLGRWLAVTAGLFIASALVLAVRRFRTDRVSPGPSGAAAAADELR